MWCNLLKKGDHPLIPQIFPKITHIRKFLLFVVQDKFKMISFRNKKNSIQKGTRFNLAFYDGNDS